ncbi:unnamed protein product [Anisakis simplex]|uniref:Uncharacterized protein n=1 Tax=Anisakis simplex TaxID=6269 RepID=A0A0M3KF67_ANISI|nr:unnamed protein product [Anisakis simplex]
MRRQRSNDDNDSDTDNGMDDSAVSLAIHWDDMLLWHKVIR